ncbi:MAG: helix-turn-helix domain-containing protein [Deltaproteobacteria bacterium]|nr:helix-turn-helix domain-containing protein [Deltaproteobacteria bacterium]
MRSRTESREYDPGIEGASITLLDVEVHRCPHCGEEAVGIRNLLGLHRRIAQELVSKTARLAPAEVRFLRLHLGLTVTDLAGRMGVTRSAASRWESATKPLAMRATTERLLRLMVAVEDGAPFETSRLSELGLGEVSPLRMRLRASRAAWRDAH